MLKIYLQFLGFSYNNQYNIRYNYEKSVSKLIRRYMETTDWQSIIPAGIAISIFLGGMFMMFTNLWTDSVKKK